MPSMSEYLYITHPFRDGFFDQPTAEETYIMKRRIRYLTRAVDKGFVIFAGSCLDNTFDMVLLNDMDESAAQAFMLSDPAVKSNIMMAELHPFDLSLYSR